MISDTVVILCTRPESKRLPGKVFRKIAGMPAYVHIIERLLKTGLPVIVAVPQNRENMYGHPRVTTWKLKNTFEDGEGVIIPGDPRSPLHRMVSTLHAAELSYGRKFKYVVRVTHDDILIDHKTVLELVQYVRETGAGYGITPTIVDGAGVEVICRENLEAAAKGHKEPTEFVSYFVKGKGCPNPKVVKLKPRPSIERPYRMTMDYEEDAKLLEIVLRAVGPLAPLDKVAAYLDRHPHLLEINRLPTVSIYTCAFNAERWIEETVVSALYSMDVNTEYILVDDCSTDLTVTKATRVLFRAPHKLILNDENKGLASSSNIAINAARGRYILRLDADDILLPGALRNMVERIQKSAAAVVYPGYKEMDEGSTPRELMISPSVHHHAGCALMDRNMLNEIRFRDGLRHWDGLDLYKRIAKRFGVAYYNEPMWLYRRHGGNMSKPSPEREAVKEKL